VEVEIGMERTNFRLLPGETIRQPSVLVLVRKNQTRREFKTLVHRFMLDNKVPRDSRGQIIPPILAVASGGGNKTPQMMADILQYCVNHRMPFDTYWVDAGWYGAPHEDELFSNCGPNWAKYVGDWRVTYASDRRPAADCQRGPRRG
jgi:alpha-galactosidase